MVFLGAEALYRDEANIEPIGRVFADLEESEIHATEALPSPAGGYPID